MGLEDVQSYLPRAQKTAELLKQYGNKLHYRPCGRGSWSLEHAGKYIGKLDAMVDTGSDLPYIIFTLVLNGRKSEERVEIELD
ncbi:MAG: hypothetical protein HYW23_02655 [Candidatus Aenigmarchaeota archaeon]|nr:hypothetical protein [Candidatus Aenigmarchaeota archaeon]